MIPKAARQHLLPTLKSTALALLFPGWCELCGQRAASGRTLCGLCAEELPRTQEPFCPRCGECFEGDLALIDHCPNCHQLHLSFECARGALKYDGEVSHLIHRLKYQKDVPLARELAHPMAELFHTDPRLNLQNMHNPLLVPVPMWWARERSRWYNQADELARALSHLIHTPWKRTLKRTQDSTPQARLTRAQRLKNLQSTITLADPKTTSGRDIILIDDVFTTGATTNTCAHVLKKQGQAQRIYALAAARA